MEKKGIRGLFETFVNKRLTTVAGAWVYYFLTSVIPLAFLLITAFGVFGVDLKSELVYRLPEEFRSAGETIASTAEKASNGVTFFFIITVIFSCSTLLNQMSKDGDFIYGVKSKKKRGIMRRLWAIFALGVLFSVFLSAAFLFAFGNMLFEGVYLSSNGKLFLSILVFFIVIVLSYVIILMLNRFISPVGQKAFDMALGAFCSLFIIVVGTLGLTIYLRLSGGYNAFYGSLAAIVVFLFWTYILMLGLAIGVMINMRIYVKRQQKTSTERSGQSVTDKELDKGLRKGYKGGRQLNA